VRFATRPASVPHKSDGINLQQERRSATVGRGLGVENMRPPEGLLQLVNVKRALMQQVAQILGRIPPVYEIVSNMFRITYTV
jgi:hypothetical protein